MHILIIIGIWFAISLPAAIVAGLWLKGCRRLGDDYDYD